MQYIKPEVRKRILDAALREFDEKGYDSASMRSIAEGAGTSLGNLYRYFENKNDIYRNCLVPVLEQGVLGTGQVFDVTEQAILETASGMASFVDQHRREFRIIARGPAEQYNAFLEHLTDCIAGKLKQRASGRAVHNPVFFDAVSLAFISSLRTILEKEYTLEQMRAYILELMQFLFADFDARMELLQL